MYKNNRKVLFIFSGKRKSMMEQVGQKKAPDTQLYGMNHIDSSIEVSTVEFADTFWYRIFGERLDFRLKHLLLYFYTKNADIVFGSSLLYTVIFKKIFRSRSFKRFFL